MRKLAVLALALLVGGCPGPVSVEVICPSLKTWSSADQKALADALGPIPESSQIWQMEYDWGMMRDEIRACQKTNHQGELK